MPFRPVPNRVDYVELEHAMQAWWDEHNIPKKYMQRNQASEKRWSFIDGPITANNPMGVHHAWGRSYKDLYNRYRTMRGYKLRYQNGFDGQGLWIEVEVEKEKGFRSKRDIERFGIADFVEACKQRVLNFSERISQQSVRLGYWMDWDNSYQTMSDENNYSIWLFLKKVWEKGWLYKGKDTMPWCPSCGTGMSQQEIVTEGYQETTHKSVYLKFPITGRLEGTTGLTPVAGESLLVWTTTPWTLAANVAAAVNPELTYVRVRQGDDVFYVSKGALGEAVRGEHEVLGEVQGADLIGLTYRGPFDDLLVQAGVQHRIIRWDDVSDAEGTGIVHIAPGAGAEDFALSREYGLDVIAPLEEDGTYTVGGGFGFLEGRGAGEVPEEVFASLNKKGLLYRVHDYTHRYPHCWRCGSELVFRLVDEWFIAMDGRVDGATSAGAGAEPQTLRRKIMEVTAGARWIPEFGLARELDWLRNMHDWMISKKRYYGLALPIYECAACGDFEVIGSEVELQARAVEGWAEFEGHSPHRPYVDAVKIACRRCGEPVERIKDVGNPWLDAGIVPFSTLDYRHDKAYWAEWFPADWVSESFPGQFRNWFYAMLAIGTVMVLDTEHEGTPPFLNLFSYALLRDENGEEMHKSKGNAIWLEDAAEHIGADVMRWLYLRAQPANNLNFGWNGADEIKRGFFSTLWNTYSFFITYANIDGWTPSAELAGGRPDGGDALRGLTELDRWALSELNQLVATCTHALDNYDSMTACRQIEEFVESLSNWYVRRSRRRFWKSESDVEKAAAYETLWTCLTTVNRLMAPMVPFMAEDMYQNLVSGVLSDAPESLHLTDWPVTDEALIDRELSAAVRVVQRLTSLGRAARARANIKVRQPLAAVYVRVQSAAEADAIRRLAAQVTEELNVKALYVIEDDSDFFEYQVRPNLPVLGPRLGSDVGRLQRALAQADKAWLVRETGAGKPLTLDGFELQPDELLVSMTGKLGYAVAEEAGYAVAIATDITQELADEGMAREVVRRVQELRKAAGFEISDRISLYYEGDGDIQRVLTDARWRDYIAQETLATGVTNGAGGHSEAQEIDGRKVTLGVERV